MTGEKRRAAILQLLQEQGSPLSGTAIAQTFGVSRQAINAIESGKFVPSTVLALKMANLFEKPVEELFILDDED